MKVGCLPDCPPLAESPPLVLRHASISYHSEQKNSDSEKHIACFLLRVGHLSHVNEMKLTVSPEIYQQRGLAGEPCVGGGWYKNQILIP